jgi:hypothetical protein
MADENGSGNTGQPGDWIAGITDEGLRTYVQQKGFKDPAAVAESYRNFEKLQGVPQDRLLKLPDKPDAPEWDGIYTRLGRPEKPDGYGLEGDKALLDKMLPAMHAAGVSKSQAAKLAEVWNGYVGEMVEASERERATADAAAMTELRGKWAAEFDKNSEIARRAGREFGLSEDEFKAISGSLGSGKTLELFQRIGSRLGEAGSFGNDGNTNGGGGAFGLTKEAAKARITQLTTDADWNSRYLGGGKAELEEMTRLTKIIAGD